MPLFTDRVLFDDRVMEKIVVGVDGSEAAKDALDWALSRARSEDVLVLVHTWSIPAMSGFELPVSNLTDFEVAAKRLVNNIVAEIDVDDGPTIETDIRSGHAGLRLAALSADADLVVVGSRGYGGFKGMLLGSVSTYVVHHAKCPVAVIPRKDDDED